MAAQMPLQVDVTAWAIARITQAGFAGSAAERPASMLDRIPFVQPVLAGGSDDGLILDQPTLVLHCFADRQPAANQLAMRTAALFRSLVGTIADGAVLTRVTTISGVTVASVEDTNLRHAVITLRPIIKTAF